MLSGIEILNVIVETSYHFGWSPLGFAFLAAGIVFIAACIFAVMDWEGEVATVLGIIGGILLVISFILFGVANKVDTYSYEVKVEDTVQMNEFLERYEVLEQRDKIYVIQERDEEASHINRAEE